jgi:DNA-binding transcriptional MerR regulator/methylmalonyl-CoA mutase cobalamin-binding subunit
MADLHHSITIASRRSGLTPHVIRVWERRYGAVEPARTGSNRRLYSEAEIERLCLLRHAIAEGHRIGSIARLPAAELEQMVGTVVGEPAAAVRLRNGHVAATESRVEECLLAIRRMDARGFEEALTRALVTLGHQGLLQRVIAPLAGLMGDLWQEGTLSAAHEHFASALIRSFLGIAGRPVAASETSPCLVVATPSGQLHELGAVMVSSAARNAGWRVAYLGVCLPAAEIAGAAVQNRARAVALSLVYPLDDPDLPLELASLRRFLPSDVKLIVGGRAAPSYREVLHRMGALLAEDLNQLSRLLGEMRLPGRAS